MTKTDAEELAEYHRRQGLARMRVGSPEARAEGCICGIDPENPDSPAQGRIDIDPECPVHAGPDAAA